MSPDDTLTGFVTLTRDEILDTVIRLALAEDVGSGDWTTLWTVDPAGRGSAVVVAKAPLVVAGSDVATRAFRAVDPALEVVTERADGVGVVPGDVILRVEGALRSILTAERTALNFLGRLSGIATLTRRFVEAVDGTRTRIVDTRKTTPGWRALEKDAVRAGGGMNHRMGLYDMVLIKENHIAAAGGAEEALALVDRHNRLGLPVEVEVTSLRELDQVLRRAPDRILLDNMSNRDMREAVRRVGLLGKSRPEIEASGNVTLETVRAVAEIGVDMISVGALTHSAPAADLSLQVLD